MNYLILLNLLIFFQVTVYEGTILRVIDGDTFVFQTSTGTIKVRLDGIDCPEKKQAYGTEARDFLNRFINNKCKVEKKKIDRYGRTTGILWINDVNINLLMVQEGIAWHFKKYSNDVVLANAEIKAREAKKGLWKNENAIAPWDWRDK